MGKESRTIYTILGMLSIEPMTGYEIRKEIMESTSFFWSESDGQIYPTLARCLNDGFVSIKIIETKGQRKTKKLYSITLKGRTRLKEWLHESVRSSTARNELLLKLFFGANIPVEESIYHIRSKQKRIKEKLKLFEMIRKSIIKNEEASPHFEYWLITIDYGISHAKCTLKWCEESLKKLARRK